MKDFKGIAGSVKVSRFISLDNGCYKDTKKTQHVISDINVVKLFSFSCDEAKCSRFARSIHFIVSLFSQFAAKWQLEEGEFYFCWQTSVTDSKLFAPNPSVSRAYNRRESNKLANLESTLIWVSEWVTWVKWRATSVAKSAFLWTSSSLMPFL